LLPRGHHHAETPGSAGSSRSRDYARLAPHAPTKHTLTRWARDPRTRPIKTALAGPQTPVTVIEHPRVAWALAIEISGRKPLSPRAPFRPRHPTPLVRTVGSGSLRASPARIVEPCDSPYVSALDASDSVTASRRLSTSTHASVSFRLRSKDLRLSPCRRVGRFTTPYLRPASAGLRFHCRFIERYLLESTPQTQPLTPLSLRRIEHARISDISREPAQPSRRSPVVLVS